MKSADLRHKAVNLLAESTSAAMNGRIEPADWMASLEDVDALMTSARRKEAEELAELEERWSAIKAEAEASIERSAEVARDLWKNFFAGAVVGGVVVYLIGGML